MSAIVPGTLFTNDGRMLFCLISLIDDVGFVWRWGSSTRLHEWDVDDDERPKSYEIVNFDGWVKTYPVTVLWHPGVHRSLK